ncbi:hypothetical protein ECG_09480 [Echinococcus granulosus]|uniref:Pfam-B_17098 domain containing protein n=1 Tax=Echinococcus granulosus TaxID=6210 RepID=A0A068WQC8_ECHGR|nr:hypothetical protein ECG_09480 [Echinococcus granulosus]CDS20713.1 Pfam-B_17098 domain containing protein [Echinococcus granulosus]
MLLSSAPNTRKKQRHTAASALKTPTAAAAAAAAAVPDPLAMDEKQTTNNENEDEEIEVWGGGVAGEMRVDEGTPVPPLHFNYPLSLSFYLVNRSDHHQRLFKKRSTASRAVCENAIQMLLCSPLITNRLSAIRLVGL